MAEKSNEQLVRLLIGAAFHEGTLEHRDSPSYATLQKARNAVETAQAAVLARMAGPGEVARAVAAEREACADVAERTKAPFTAHAIRARGPS